jgi:MauM/NapG family ferredoxin protein
MAELARRRRYKEPTALNQPSNFSRRDFLRGRILPAIQNAIDGACGVAAPNAAPKGPESQALTSRSPQSQGTSPRFERAFPVLRPPGAVAENDFLTGCTRCEACIQACPSQSIVHAPTRFRRAEGTPMIDPIQQPCWMCADFPCIAACEPQVLQLALPKRMATARIETFSCLAWQGSFCTICSEQCPVPDAIVLEAGGKPRIVDEVCTGCGVCQYICPAPENAILLLPLAERPSSVSKELPLDGSH